MTNSPVSNFQGENKIGIDGRAYRFVVGICLEGRAKAITTYPERGSHRRAHAYEQRTRACNWRLGHVTRQHAQGGSWHALRYRRTRSTSGGFFSDRLLPDRVLAVSSDADAGATDGRPM